MNIRFYLSYDIIITSKTHFKHENARLCHLLRIVKMVVIMLCYIVQKLYTTSGLSILLHGVMLLPDVTSCDKDHYKMSSGYIS